MGVESVEVVEAYVGAWFGAMLSRGACPVLDGRLNMRPFCASSEKRFLRS